MSELEPGDIVKYLFVLVHSDWRHNDVEITELSFVLPKGDGDDHYVDIVPSGNDGWYGILHIGELGPDEDPLENPNLRGFGSFEAAWAWSIRYTKSHPDGIDPDSLDTLEDWEEITDSDDSDQSDDPDDSQYYDWSVHQ